MKKLSLFWFILFTFFSVVCADEDEVIEGSKHIIDLDLSMRSQIDSDTSDNSPRDEAFGSGYLVSYKYLLGLGIDVNADHSAPHFMFLQHPSYIGGKIGIDDDRFDGRTSSGTAPFRLDKSSNVTYLEIEGQHFFKNSLGIDYRAYTFITSGTRFQVYDDADQGTTGLERLDETNYGIELGIKKYFKNDHLLFGFKVGFESLSGEKPFHTGTRDDTNDVDGDTISFQFDVDFLTESEKWKFGMSYLYGSHDRETNSTINDNNRDLTLPADVAYKADRDETIHDFELRLKYLVNENVAINLTYNLLMISDDLGRKFDDDDFESANLPFITGRDIVEHRFLISPEMWIFNRMKLSFDQGIVIFDFDEEADVGYSTLEYSYINWYTGAHVEILF